MAESTAKKGGLLTRAKKNVGGKVATSALGKKALPSEAKQLLKALRKIIEKEGGKKKSEEMEKNILKILVKMKVHVDDKSVDIDAFLQADKPLRAAFEIIYDCFDYYNDMESERTKKSLQDRFGKVEKLLKEAEAILTGILKSHLQQGSIDRITAIFAYLGTADFFMRVWQTPGLYEDLFQLVNAMNKYTQFHF